MKISAIMIILFFSALLTAETEQLNSFEELMNALNKGEMVRVVAHYGDCKLISDNEEKSNTPNAIGGMNIDVYEYFASMSVGNPKAFVVFSHSKLINYGGFIYNYAKFKVNEDNTVQITAQYAEPQEFRLEMNEKFYSTINNGENDGAVFFYKLK